MDGLSEHLFWDVRREGLDPELHAAWLVQRVLEYGRWRDWKLIETHYGKPRLAEIVVKIRCLEPRSFAFCCARFNLSPTLFRCILTLFWNAHPMADLDVTKEAAKVTKFTKINSSRHANPLNNNFEIVGRISICSIPETAAITLNAIANRGSKKDFFDLVELLNHFSLEEMIGFFSEKYRSSDPITVIRSLAWFEDAEAEPDPISLREIDWPSVKRTLSRAVSTF